MISGRSFTATANKSKLLTKTKNKKCYGVESTLRNKCRFVSDSGSANEAWLNNGTKYGVFTGERWVSVTKRYKAHGFRRGLLKPRCGTFRGINKYSKRVSYHKCSIIILLRNEINEVYQ